MAPVSRRPATRSHPSSTQEVDFPLLCFDDDDDNEEKENHVLTQVEEYGRVNVSFAVNDNDTYRPQLDNPSAMLPGDSNDIDTALQEYLLSQNNTEQQQEEFELDILEDESTDEEEEDDDNNNNVPSYTQGTLDAASILVGGFGAVKHNFNNDSDEEEEEEELEEPKQKTPLASSIAAQLRTHGLTGTGLTEEEIQFVDNVDEGKNKKQYDDSQLRYEKRFFQTVAEFGGDILAPLSKDQVANPHDTQEHNRLDHSFYSVCGGDKTADKHAIMNKCFILCGMKWQCLSGKNKGKTIQPNSFCKMMQCLTYLFNRKGVKYLFNEDFNSKGDFHGVMKVIWREVRKKDPTFGTGANRARVDKSLVRKFIQAVRDKRLRPYEEPEHLLICVIFILGYCCGLRGSSEHINLDCEMIYLGEYTVEDGEELAGLKWGGVKVPFSKTNQLNMNNTKLPVDEDVLLTFTEQPWHDCFDPYDLFCFYIAHVHPKAKKFYGRLVKQGPKKEGERLQKEFGRPVWFAESGHGRTNWNLGPTKHRELCKKIALFAGVANWEACTGHALRALCITHCIASKMTAVDVAAKVRHKSLNSQKDYATDCNERKATRLLAMNNEPANDSNLNQKRASVKPKEVAPDAVIVQTQPMLPQNRNEFLHVTKKRRVDSENEGKENAMVSDLDSELEQLKKQNEILRLKKENQRMQDELTGSSGARSVLHSPIPRRHGRSFPPSYHRDRSPLEDRFYFPIMPTNDYRSDGYRHSYPPPTNHYHRNTPPRYYDERHSGPYERHGEYDEEDYRPYPNKYHRR